MSKYIDSDKLLAEIKLQFRSIENATGDYAEGRRWELENLNKLITSLQQEQPEVNLEKFADKIKTFQARYKYPESTSIKGAMAFMARMFYQYPNAARQWYENLPKATMD